MRPNPSPGPPQTPSALSCCPPPFIESTAFPLSGGPASVNEEALSCDVGCGLGCPLQGNDALADEAARARLQFLDLRRDGEIHFCLPKKRGPARGRGRKRR